MRNGGSPDADRVKCPISLVSLSSCRFLLLNARGFGQSLQQTLDVAAGRMPAIDLKLRLALRVVALAAACLIVVAGYDLFDSERAARAKVSRIAEIVAKDISLQEEQWYGNTPCRRNPLRTCNGSRRR